MFETSTTVQIRANDDYAAEAEHPDLDALDREIATLASQLDAARYRFLTLIGTFDACEGYAPGGFRSCAHYLSWRVNLGLGAAREHVRVARALPELPKISDAFRRGQLSYSKVRAMTRVATPENEERLLTMALASTAPQLEKIVRGLRRCQDPQAANDEAQRQHAARYLSLRHEDDGSLRVEGRLPPELGAELQKALEVAMDVLAERASGRNVSTGTPEHSEPCPRPSVGQQRADALVHLARSAMDQQLKIGSGADRLQVLLREEASPGGSALQDLQLPDATLLAPETARRLCCDATLVTPGERKRRLPTTQQRRALQARQPSCSFPGCTHGRFLQPHHIEHWADGGPTTIDNLTHLCSFHHLLVHEGGFDVKRKEDGTLAFSAPDGRCLPETPKAQQPTDPEQAIAQLSDMLDREGIVIDVDTAGRWEGDPLDLGWAVDLLLDTGCEQAPQSAERLQTTTS